MHHSGKAHHADANARRVQRLAVAFRLIAKRIEAGSDDEGRRQAA